MNYMKDLNNKLLIVSINFWYTLKQQQVTLCYLNWSSMESMRGLRPWDLFLVCELEMYTSVGFWNLKNPNKSLKLAYSSVHPSQL